MNYIDFHIGDFEKDTKHLTMAEEGAYMRLLKKYYTDEAPLENDLPKLHRKLLCRNDEEKEAMATVLSEFFKLSDEDGCWHQKKADELIAVYKDGEPARALKRENENRRQRENRDRRTIIFARLHELGLNPLWNTPNHQLYDILKQAESAPPIRGGNPIVDNSGPVTTDDVTVTGAVTPVTRDGSTDVTPVTRDSTAPVTPVTATQYARPNPQSPSPNTQSPKEGEGMQGEDGGDAGAEGAAAPDVGGVPGDDLPGDKEKPKPKAKPYDADNVELPACISRELWQRWCKHRREIRKPLTQTSVGQQLHDLTDWNAKGVCTPREAIAKAIRSGAQGLFPPSGAPHRAARNGGSYPGDISGIQYGDAAAAGFDTSDFEGMKK